MVIVVVVVELEVVLFFTLVIWSSISASLVWFLFLSTLASSFSFLARLCT